MGHYPQRLDPLDQERYTRTFRIIIVIKLNSASSYFGTPPYLLTSSPSPALPTSHCAPKKNPSMHRQHFETPETTYQQPPEGSRSLPPFDNSGALGFCTNINSDKWPFGLSLAFVACISCPASRHRVALRANVLILKTRAWDMGHRAREQESEIIHLQAFYRNNFMATESMFHVRVKRLHISSHAIPQSMATSSQHLKLDV